MLGQPVLALGQPSSRLVRVPQTAVRQGEDEPAQNTIVPVRVFVLHGMVHDVRGRALGHAELGGHALAKLLIAPHVVVGDQQVRVLRPWKGTAGRAACEKIFGNGCGLSK